MSPERSPWLEALLQAHRACREDGRLAAAVNAGREEARLLRAVELGDPAVPHPWAEHLGRREIRITREEPLGAARRLREEAGEQPVALVLGMAPAARGWTRDTLIRACTTVGPLLLEEPFRGELARFRHGPLRLCPTAPLLWVPRVLIFQEAEIPPRPLPEEDWQWVSVLACDLPWPTPLPREVPDSRAIQLDRLFYAAAAWLMNVLCALAARAWRRALSRYRDYFDVLQVALGPEDTLLYEALTAPQEKPGVSRPMLDVFLEGLEEGTDYRWQDGALLLRLDPADGEASARLRGPEGLVVCPLPAGKDGEWAVPPETLEDLRRWSLALDTPLDRGWQSPRWPYVSIRGRTVSPDRAIDILSRSGCSCGLVPPPEQPGLFSRGFPNEWDGDGCCGWCRPDGRLGYDGTVWKNPSLDEIFQDVLETARVFPWLDFTVAVSDWEEMPPYAWESLLRNDPIRERVYPRFSEHISLALRYRDNCIEILGPERGRQIYEDYDRRYGDLPPEDYRMSRYDRDDPPPFFTREVREQIRDHLRSLGCVEREGQR